MFEDEISESNNEQHMKLIERELGSLGLIVKARSVQDEKHFIDHWFSQDMRYKEVCLLLNSEIPFWVRAKD